MYEKYITDEERIRCQKIADVFKADLENGDIVIKDTGRYGFVMLQYYPPINGFDDVITFTDSADMFHMLFHEWLNIQLIALAREMNLENIDYDDVFELLPADKQRKLIDKKKYFLHETGLKQADEKKRAGE